MVEDGSVWGPHRANYVETRVEGFVTPRGVGHGDGAFPGAASYDFHRFLPGGVSAGPVNVGEILAAYEMPLRQLRANVFRLWRAIGQSADA